jgi:hypothetical protein
MVSAKSAAMTVVAIGGRAVPVSGGRAVFSGTVVADDVAAGTVSGVLLAVGLAIVAAGAGVLTGEVDVPAGDSWQAMSDNASINITIASTFERLVTIGVTPVHYCDNWLYFNLFYVTCQPFLFNAR